MILPPTRPNRALFAAIGRKDVTRARVALAAGADVNAGRLQGAIAPLPTIPPVPVVPTCSPLLLATLANDAAMVHCLLAHGAPVWAPQGVQGRNPIEQALRNPALDEALEAFVERLGGLEGFLDEAQEKARASLVLSSLAPVFGKSELRTQIFFGLTARAPDIRLPPPAFGHVPWLWSEQTYHGALTPALVERLSAIVALPTLESLGKAHYLDWVSTLIHAGARHRFARQVWSVLDLRAWAHPLPPQRTPGGVRPAHGPTLLDVALEARNPAALSHVARLLSRADAPTLEHCWERWAPSVAASAAKSGSVGSWTWLRANAPPSALVLSNAQDTLCEVLSRNWDCHHRIALAAALVENGAAWDLGRENGKGTTALHLLCGNDWAAPRAAVHRDRALAQWKASGGRLDAVVDRRGLTPLDVLRQSDPQAASRYHAQDMESHLPLSSRPLRPGMRL